MMNNGHISPVLVIDRDGRVSSAVRSCLAAVFPGRLKIMTVDTVDAGIMTLSRTPSDLVMLGIGLLSRNPGDIVRTVRDATMSPLLLLARAGERAAAADLILRGDADGYIPVGDTVDPVIVERMAGSLLSTGRPDFGVDALRCMNGVTSDDLRVFIEMNADGIIVLDDGGHVVLMNTAAEELFGRRRDEFVGSLFGFPVTGGDTTEIDIHRLDGGIVTAEMKVVRAGHGESGVFILSIRDLTEHRKRENELRESRESYRSMVEDTDDIIMRFDSGLRHLFVNPALGRMFGNHRDVKGLTPREAGYPDEFRDFLDKRVRSVIRGGLPVEATMPYKTGDGVTGLGFLLEPERDGSGQVTSVVCRARLLHDSGGDWSGGCGDDGDLDRFAGDVANDLNAVLAAIAGSISDARTRAGDNEGVDKALADAEARTARARDLTGKLIMFSGSGMPITRAVDLADVIGECVDGLPKRAGLRCEVELPEGLRPVDADGLQIRLMFRHLLFNAANAIGGVGTIGVRCREVTVGNDCPGGLDHGDYVMLTVEDEGRGMSPDVLERAFDPYYTTNDGSDGLGLAIVRSIVTRHRGWITVTSEPGEGSVFTVMLPVSADTAASRERGNSRTAAVRRILLHEGERPIREVFTTMLEFLGHTVMQAAKPDEVPALHDKACRTGRPFDLVILDINTIPDMEFGELLGRLREIDPTVKVVVSSVFSTIPVMKQPLQDGYLALLPKPMKLDDIRMVMSRILPDDISR